MLLQPGHTQCEACHAHVYAIDDLFVVRNWKGVEEISGCRTGFFHYDCFLRAKFAAEYLELNARQTAQDLDRRADQWRTVARDGDFALLYKPQAEQYTLYFLRLGRSVDFFDQASTVQLLRDVVAGMESAGDARLVAAGEAMSLQFPDAAVISVKFAPADYQRLLDHLPKQDAEPADFDLGALCRKLGVVPQHIDCDLPRAQGAIVSREPLAASGASYIDLEVPRTSEVRMPAAAFDRLRSFAASALEALRSNP
jgi:hypothetical protein